LPFDLQLLQRQQQRGEPGLQEVHFWAVGVDVDYSGCEADVHAVAVEAEHSSEAVPVVDHAAVHFEGVVGRCRLVTEGAVGVSAGLVAVGGHAISVHRFSRRRPFPARLPVSVGEGPEVTR
jgi:hypothetical protein